MQQFQSLQRLLIFYALTLLVMLSLYYVTLFDVIKHRSEQHSIDTFQSLQHSIIERAAPIDVEIEKILEQPAFDHISYQLILMMPSGQTYIHRKTRPSESAFATVTLPTMSTASNNQIAYKVNRNDLTGTIKLESGHQIYITFRHEPLAINWISYRYWLPLTLAFMLFFIALFYMLNRRTNWEQLLVYTDNLSSHARESYAPPPFLQKKSTTEFLLLGHALSRVSFQLHNDYRRIKTLQHRLERLVDQAPLPMLMSVRLGQISFYNQRFEKIFTPSTKNEPNHELTDFFMGKDEATQQALQTIASLRVSRTLTVYGIENKQAYQLHITPWFGEHGQIHGFTGLLNNVHELVNQNEQLQRQNTQLQRQLDEFNELKSVIGHKLRIPLEAMIDILEPIDPNTLNARQNKTLDTLITTSQNMLIALNETLHIGNIEVRKNRLNIEPVDIYKLGQDVNELVIQNIRQKGLELIYFFSPDCPRSIDTDDGRLRQTLLNLLHNAVKFTACGHVALIIEAVDYEQMPEKNKETLYSINKNSTTTETNCWVRFSVRDTGIGITPAKQHHLLSYLNKPRHQETNTVAKQAIDTGLGLKNVNSFARLLGGFIELKSTVNEGSAFNLYLPCRRPHYQPVYHPSQHLRQICLIAVVHQPLVAEHLQRLCNHLAISATIYTAVDLTTIEQLTKQLNEEKQSLAPLLLLDYEYYDTSTILVDDEYNTARPNDYKKSLVQSQTKLTETHFASSHHIATNIDRRQALDSLFANTSLPKILFSMKPERRIPSVLLDQCDGYLVKPLDSALLLSELLRLTLPARQKLTQTQHSQGDVDEKPPQEESSQNVLPLILVVEDSPTNQKIACKMLSKLGYRSIVAEDGQQALDILACQRGEISLILMDCRMPVMDGLQATQAIRAQGDDIPIVALTANNTAEDRHACMEVGMDDFLSKPISKKDFAAVLQRFMS